MARRCQELNKHRTLDLTSLAQEMQHYLSAYAWLVFRHLLQEVVIGGMFSILARCSFWLSVLSISTDVPTVVHFMRSVA